MVCRFKGIWLTNFPVSADKTSSQISKLFGKNMVENKNNACTDRAYLMYSSSLCPEHKPSTLFSSRQGFVLSVPFTPRPADPYPWFSRHVINKTKIQMLKKISFYLRPLKYFQLGSALCFENRAVWISDFLDSAWHKDGYRETYHVYENVDSPCVFWGLNNHMFIKVSMRMFASSKGKRKFLT